MPAERRPLDGRRRQGQEQGRTEAALGCFELLRMDGDERTSVERQNAGPAGISSSCHALCTALVVLREQSREVPSCHRDRSVAIGHWC
jgi:hypothetical protein